MGMSPTPPMDVLIKHQYSLGMITKEDMERKLKKQKETDDFFKMAYMGTPFK